jgi:NADPH-dependent glutamate synthase beta subunit-like oxidoreductase
MDLENLYICKVLYLGQPPVVKRANRLEHSTDLIKEIHEKILDEEKLKNCFECGICTASCSMTEMLGTEYSPRKLLEDIYSNPEDVLASEAIWFCAWCYRCHSRCPQALDLPEIFLFMRSTAAKRGYTQGFDKALQKIVKNVPLPLVTTVVCFHPERASLKTDEVLDRIEQMREEQVKSKKKERSAKSSKRKIAIIGSGPAGLTAAYELGRKGCNVTVFEALSEAGGMLRKGIPEKRLPKQLVVKEIQFIKDLGVEIKTGMKIGKDLHFDDLKKEGFKAVFIAAGAHKSHRLKIEGLELKGVTYALDFLWDVNTRKRVDVGKNVVVIGGGNVAVDAARTARFLGADEVTILYRRSKDEMPANLREVQEAEHERVKIEFLVSPKRVLGENGKVIGIECAHMQLGEPDETGRKKASPVEGSDFKRETDMVILAIGETPELGFLPREIELNEDGTLWVNPITMETSLRGVFGGGDAVTGPASVIEAIRDGKRAAESIEKYIKALEE